MPKKQPSFPSNLNSSDLGRHFNVAFKPLSHPVWVHGKRLVTSSNRAIPPEVLAVLVTSASKPISMRLSHIGYIAKCQHLTLELNSDGWSIEVTRDYILEMVEDPDKKQLQHSIDGLESCLVFQSNGEAEVGCQTITKLGLRQVFEVLADHFGYNLEDWKYTRRRRT